MSISTLQDWVQLAQLIGNHEGVPTLVGVDENGNLIALIKDPVSGNYVRVDDSGYLTTIMKGSYGTTLKSIAVDANGNLIALIKDPVSGNYVKVDASGYLTSVMKGTYGATLKTIAVDENGNLIALIKDPLSGNYVKVDASGYLTTIMKGIDGTTLRTIAVDSNGNIVGVFKGEYQGEYKTLQTDNAGRLIAVLTDPEDAWGVFRKMGLGELSNRLNPLFALDRRGDIVFWHTFDKGHGGFSFGKYTADGKFDISIDGAYVSPYTMHLQTGTTEGDNVYIIKYTPLSFSSPVGYAVLFSCDYGVSYITIKLKLWVGNTYNQAYVRLDMVNYLIQYMDKNLVWQTIDSLPGLTAGSVIPFFLKLVINPVTHKYQRVIFCDREYDLSSYNLYYAATSYFANLQSWFYVYNKTGLSANAWVSGIIVTQNEPT